MTYSIYNDGHLLASYGDALEVAQSTMIELAHEAPSEAATLTLLAVNDDGTVADGYVLDGDHVVSLAATRAVAHAA